MLEVKSSQLNEGTGHWRMTVYSTLTKCTLSIIEMDDGIVEYKHCPKKVTDDQIIEKLNHIKERHLSTPVSTYAYDLASDEISDLIELIKDRPHQDKEEQVRFPIGILKLEGL